MSIKFDPSIPSLLPDGTVNQEWLIHHLSLAVDKLGKEYAKLHASLRTEWGVLYPSGKVVTNDDLTEDLARQHAPYPRTVVRRLVSEWTEA